MNNKYIVVLPADIAPAKIKEILQALEDLPACKPCRPVSLATAPAPAPAPATAEKQQKRGRKKGKSYLKGDFFFKRASLPLLRILETRTTAGLLTNAPELYELAIAAGLKTSLDSVRFFLRNLLPRGYATRHTSGRYTLTAAGAEKLHSYDS